MAGKSKTGYSNPDGSVTYYGGDIVGDPTTGNYSRTENGDTYEYKGGRLVRLTDERGNVSTWDANGKKTTVGPTGDPNKISKSKADTERYMQEAANAKREDEIMAEWDKRYAEIEAKLKPYLAVGEEALKDLARYRADPAAFVEGQYGFKEGQKQGVSAIETAASARGDFLGDGSKKRIARFEVDYLAGKKDQALGQILSLLGVGQAATGASVNNSNTVANAGMQTSLAGMQAEGQQSGYVHNAIAQAAMMRNMEMLQRSQQIADRQTAVINAGGNLLAATPALIPKPMPA